MDDLTSSLANSFAVSKSEKGSFTTSKQHPRFDSFKVKPDTNSQNDRRRKYLERQKTKRRDAQTLARKIAEDNLSDLESEFEELDNQEVEPGSERCSYFAKPNKKHKVPRLMLSEWLVDIPENFTTSCYVMPCPTGKRNLVTACKGMTVASTKFGLPVYEFPSLLPNGNRPNGSRFQKYGYTILDCVFCTKSNKFYCLDVLSWNGHPVLDCETEFRFFWLQSKFQENPEVCSRSRLNKAPFELLPFFPCSDEGILEAVKYFPPEQLDGLWFFHKQTHYHLGVTPLVGWLKAHMIETVLGIKVPEEYCVIKEKTKPKAKVVDQAVTVPAYDANENYWAMPSKNSSQFTDSEMRSHNINIDYDDLMKDVTGNSVTGDIDLSSDW